VFTKTFAIDFAKSDDVAFRNLAAAFKDLDVGVLGTYCWDVF
jgi:hypothetical protein